MELLATQQRAFPTKPCPAQCKRAQNTRFAAFFRQKNVLCFVQNFFFLSKEGFSLTRRRCAEQKMTPARNVYEL